MRQLPFTHFDPRKAVRIYLNNLPHWRQKNATYFITFRLADSIPKKVLDGWEDEKRTWLRVRHGIQIDRLGEWKKDFENLPPKDRTAYRREFHHKLNDCLDQGLGSCALKDQRCATIVLEKALTFDGQRYDLGDLVVMPNHVHLLITPYPGHGLEALLQGIKGVSSREINRLLELKGTFWQKDSFDHIVRDRVQLKGVQEYIRANPEKAGMRPDSCIRYAVEYRRECDRSVASTAVPM